MKRLLRIGYVEGEDRVLDYDASLPPVATGAEAHSLSFAEMGALESEKMPLASCCRRTPDGREWIVVGKSWKLLADLDNEDNDWRDKHTRWR